MTELPRPRPSVAPETKEFWDSTARSVLRLERCTTCADVVWYPRGFCPRCWSDNLEWIDASGLGVIYSYTVNHRGEGPYEGIDSYVLAYVDLDEGPRVLTNIVDCDPGKLSVGQPVRVVFHAVDDEVALYRFTPVEEG